jgi:hypothetical protein
MKGQGEALRSPAKEGGFLLQQFYIGFGFLQSLQAIACFISNCASRSSLKKKLFV